MRSSQIAMAIGGLVLVANVARADESKVPASEVPKAGLEAVTAMFPQAKVVGTAKETEDGKTVFEVTLKQADRTIDVTVGTDGKIQVVEKQIAEGDLPVAVKKALDAKYRNATYKIVEQVDRMAAGKPTLDFFETLLETSDKKRVEVQIKPDGTITHEESKKPGDQD